jgi:hypothetical protein
MQEQKRDWTNFWLAAGVALFLIFVVIPSFRDDDDALNNINSPFGSFETQQKASDGDVGNWTCSEVRSQSERAKIATYGMETQPKAVSDALWSRYIQSLVTVSKVC